MRQTWKEFKFLWFFLLLLRRSLSSFVGNLSNASVLIVPQVLRRIVVVSIVHVCAEFLNGVERRNGFEMFDEIYDFFFAAATWKMDFFRNPKAGTRGIQHVRRMEIEFQFIKKKLEEQEEETFSLELHVCTSAASIRL